MSSQDLKSLPIFDNDYGTAMSAFLDQNVAGTGGSGLLVDGVEANRATVSASAVQEIRINQDPYSAQYYWPGRGQMEIITKSAADHYHGQFNFLFRDSSMNAQNALAPSKPFEQRRVYEGHVTGPIPLARKSSFLFSFNRAEEDLNAVVSATIVPTPANPSGASSANVPAPTRDTEFSIRAAHQFGEKHSGYVQYSYQDWNAQNQGVGGQTLAAGGYNNLYREDDATAHLDSTLSGVLLNQFSLVAERDSSRHTRHRRSALHQCDRRFRRRFRTERFAGHRVQRGHLRHDDVDPRPQLHQVWNRHPRTSTAAPTTTTPTHSAATPLARR